MSLIIIIILLKWPWSFIIFYFHCSEHGSQGRLTVLTEWVQVGRMTSAFVNIPIASLGIVINYKNCVNQSVPIGNNTVLLVFLYAMVYK